MREGLGFALGALAATDTAGFMEATEDDDKDTDDKPGFVVAADSNEVGFVAAAAAAEDNAEPELRLDQPETCRKRIKTWISHTISEKNHL